MGRTRQAQSHLNVMGDLFYLFRIRSPQYDILRFDTDSETPQYLKIHFPNVLY